ncbi:hypothetical protein [Streptomyces sp. NPDC029526]|uniref:hypothetical protein n=1 Tax=Streptomyces sp. NPDC029526 TaxID=3155728 RepID=UPI0033F5FBEB
MLTTGVRMALTGRDGGSRTEPGPVFDTRERMGRLAGTGGAEGPRASVAQRDDVPAG